MERDLIEAQERVAKATKQLLPSHRIESVKERGCICFRIENPDGTVLRLLPAVRPKEVLHWTNAELHRMILGL